MLAAAVLVVVSNRQVMAAESIPTTSGFSGFALVGPGYFDIESNLIAKGPPLLDDVGSAKIDQRPDNLRELDGLLIRAALLDRLNNTAKASTLRTEIAGLGFHDSEDQKLSRALISVPH